jgi:hypothetical protein
MRERASLVIGTGLHHDPLKQNIASIVDVSTYRADGESFELWDEAST